MSTVSRRELLALGLSAAVGPSLASGEGTKDADLHRQLLDAAGKHETRRKARFARVRTGSDLEALQGELREAFLALLDGLPTANGPPPARVMGRIEADGYAVEKLVIESFPGYFVTALLYRPVGSRGPVPGVLSPCGHSAVGKADPTYQTLHINLAKRGFVVLTYDPVGQGERSQFWDAERGRSRFNLDCGEHAVLGNPLYLLGTNLARFRVWDGLRALDHLATVPGVDPSRIGCVGNSGGGNLTAYLAALDPRIRVAVIGCYITTLRRRMANRIEADPDADPEQDVFDFVGRGIDHAGLLALVAPRPTLLCTARFDFFPIEGARETFEEARRLYAAAGAGDRIERAEAAERHGMSRPLREAAYAWFDHWLGGRERKPSAEEVPVAPRTARELSVCPEGQVGVSLRSRPLLSLALEEFRKRGNRPRVALKELLRLDPSRAEFRLSRVGDGQGKDATQVICLNGNEGPDWKKEDAFLRALSARGYAVSVLDVRGVGALRPTAKVWGRAYEDPLVGVEENLAYNAFLVGESLLGIRVADVLAAVAAGATKPKSGRVVLCARRDAALVAILAAAVEPSIDGVAVEDALLSYLPLFRPEGQAINSASILPRMLRDFGDIPEVLTSLSPRKVLAAAPRNEPEAPLQSVRVIRERFTAEPDRILEWLNATAR